jgi:phospho-N-acetylmuramoyl-pentapeptide-transferase
MIFFRATTENVVSKSSWRKIDSNHEFLFKEQWIWLYAELLAWTGEGYEKWAWLIFIPVFDIV